MSAAAISPAPSSAPGASASSGATGAQGAQAHGSLTGFETLLAALSNAQDDTASETSGAAAATKNAAKPASGAKTAADDGKSKTKVSGDGKTAATTGAEEAATPDANLALLGAAVPTVPAISPQVVTTETSPTEGADAKSTGALADPVPGAASADLNIAAALAKLAATASTSDVDTSKAPVAAAADSAGSSASASEKVEPSIGPKSAAAPGADPSQTTLTPATSAAATTTTAVTSTATTTATPQSATVAPTDPPQPIQVSQTAQAPQTAQAAQPQPPVAAVAADATLAIAPPIPAAAGTTAGQPVAPAGVKDRFQTAKTTAIVGAAEPATTLGASTPSTPSIVKSVAALQLAAADASAGGPIDDDETQSPGLDAKAQAVDPSQTPADPAAAAIATPASLVPAATVNVRAGPQTVASLAAQIVKSADGRSTQFDVQLDPAGLGKVDVRIAIGSDGRMSAAMSFDTPQAAAELKSRAGELQRALEQSGFDVSGGMSFDVAGGQGGQGGQGQNPQTQTGAAFRGRAFQAALDTSVDAAPAPQLTLRRNALAGVDIRI